MYNVGSGKARPVAELLDRLLTFATRPSEVQRDTARFRPVDIPHIEADITRIRAETGWEARIPLDEARRETLEYWRTRPGTALTQSRST